MILNLSRIMQLHFRCKYPPNSAWS